MRVTLLGTGTSTGVPVPTCCCSVCTSDDPRDNRLRPSALLEWPGASLLIDTSTDLRQQALRYRIERIDAVLYTHAHADHMLGLDELRLYNWRQKGVIPVFGNPTTLDALTQTFWYVFSDKPAESTKPEIDRRLVDRPFELLGRQIIPVPLLHGTLPILGFRIGKMAYLTDVSEIPHESYGLLNDLDTLILSALRERPHPTHLTVEQAVETAKRIGARRTLFTHMSHEVHHATIAAQLPSGIELAYDGLIVEIDDDQP
ncbi:MAG: MBL fold metallo-hydrolase [Acidobacteriota bacterium]|nr:MBL fold metallo-hydrolase [Acidobacteriota bacterium]MDH3786728.1 MBL fold metallo-hydrolase [Acidobacteriota bacterium]